MKRNFKLALAVSLATHVVAYAVVRVATSGEGAVKREVPELPVVLLVSVQEDFLAPRTETPPAPVAPPAVVMKPERAAEPTQFTPPPETKSTEPILISRPSPTVGLSATNPISPIVVAVVVPSHSAAPPGPAPTPASEPVLITGRVKYRRAPDPEYPALARRRKQEGTVLLEVIIAPDGRAKGVTLKKSSGFPALDRAALEAVPGWEFEVSPGQPVRAEIPVRFELVK